MKNIFNNSLQNTKCFHVTRGFLQGENETRCRSEIFILFKFKALIKLFSKSMSLPRKPC